MKKHAAIRLEDSERELATMKPMHVLERWGTRALGSAAAVRRVGDGENGLSTASNCLPALIQKAVSGLRKKHLENEVV